MSFKKNNYDLLVIENYEISKQSGRLVWESGNNKNRNLTCCFDGRDSDLLLLVREDFCQRLDEARRAVQVDGLREGAGQQEDALAARLLHLREVVQQRRAQDH